MASNVSFSDHFALFVSFVVKLLATTSRSVVGVGNDRGEQGAPGREQAGFEMDSHSRPPIAIRYATKTMSGDDAIRNLTDDSDNAFRSDVDE